MGLLARTISSFEQRGVTSASSPAAWLVEALGGGPTKAGTRVSEKTAATVSTVHACVRVISEDAGRIPLNLYERLDNGDRRRAEDHPSWRLTTTTANPEMPAKPFRELLTSHAALWGAGFAEIELDGQDRPLHFWPLLPGVTRAVRRGGKKYVVTRLPNGKEVGLPPGRYLHIPGPSWMGDGLNADHPVRMAREAIGLAMAAEEFGARLFGNGARPSGILTTEKPLKEKDRKKLIHDWNTQVGGLSNAQRTALLEAAVKWQAISVNPEDAQSVETRKFQVEDVARYFRVPLFLLGQTEKATTWGTGLEQILRGYITQTLGSWLTRWEEWYGHQVLDEQERLRYYVEHVLEDLLKGDLAGRYQAYALALQNGWMSRNEVRQRENMNRIPGDGGDAYTIQINMGGLEDVAGGGSFAGALPAPRGGALVRLEEIARIYTRGAPEVGRLVRIEAEADGLGTVLVSEPEPGAELRISWKSVAGVHRSEPLGFAVRSAADVLDQDALARARTAAHQKARQLEAARRSATSRRRLQQRFVDVFEQTFGRGVRREVQALRRLAKRLDAEGSDAISPEAFVEEVAKFYELDALRSGSDLSGHMQWFGKEYRKPLTSYAELVQDEIVDERGLDEVPDSASTDVFLLAYVTRFLRRHAARSTNQMRRLVKKAGDTPDMAELRASIETRLDDWEDRRAGKMAGEESVHSGGSIARITYYAAGVVSLEWVAFGDSCPLCDELNGKVVGIQEVFVRKGETVDPGDGETQPLESRRSVLHGPLHNGCVCAVVAT